MYPVSVDSTRAGFRFWWDLNGDGLVQPQELGIVTGGNRPDIDFQVYVDVNNRVYLKPIRSGTSVAIYGNGPIADLTSIDVAPTSGYSTSAVEAVPGWGYVFQMSAADPYARFGGLRVTYASKNYVIFDWSYQTDPGNPELVPHR
jgi:hypothetical protein